jgi:hypothetical protein
METWQAHCSCPYHGLLSPFSLSRRAYLTSGRHNDKLLENWQLRTLGTVNYNMGHFSTTASKRCW